MAIAVSCEPRLHGLQEDYDVSGSVTDVEGVHSQRGHNVHQGREASRYGRDRPDGSFTYSGLRVSMKLPPNGLAGCSTQIP